MLYLGLGVLALIAFAVWTRFAARHCYRIDRGAYVRARTEWADHRRAVTAIRQ